MNISLELDNRINELKEKYEKKKLEHEKNIKRRIN